MHQVEGTVPRAGRAVHRAGGRGPGGAGGASGFKRLAPAFGAEIAAASTPIPAINIMLRRSISGTTNIKAETSH